MKHAYILENMYLVWLVPALLLMARTSCGAVTVDANLPAGNVVVEGISGDTVRLRQDLRDTAARKERERQGMKEITRKQFMGGMAATVALSWRGAFAAPARMQRGYADTTWWDPYVENITDTDTYLRRKFRQDVTDKKTGVGVEALKKILAKERGTPA